MKNIPLLNLIFSILIFLLGIIYLSFPTYYGLDVMSEIQTGNLFLSFMIIYSLFNFCAYIADRKNKKNLFLFIIVLVVGLISYCLMKTIHAFLVVPISIMIFLFFIDIYNVFIISGLNSKKDVFVSLNVVLLVILNCFGIILSFNMLNDFVLQTIMLGFFISIVGAIDFIEISFKNLKVR